MKIQKSLLSKLYFCPVVVVILVAWLWLTLCNPMDYSPPGFSICGILQARIQEWVAFRCENWTKKKAESWRTDVPEMWCWRRFLRIPWTARGSNQSILKEINSEYSLEEMMLKQKHTLAIWCEELTYWKRFWSWEILRTERKGGGRGWDDLMAWLTWWTWVWANSGW